MSPADFADFTADVLRLFARAHSHAVAEESR